MTRVWRDSPANPWKPGLPTILAFYAIWFMPSVLKDRLLIGQRQLGEQLAETEGLACMRSLNLNDTRAMNEEMFVLQATR